MVRRIAVVFAFAITFILQAVAILSFQTQSPLAWVTLFYIGLMLAGFLDSARVANQEVFALRVLVAWTSGLSIVEIGLGLGTWLGSPYFVSFPNLSPAEQTALGVSIIGWTLGGFVMLGFSALVVHLYPELDVGKKLNGGGVEG